MAYVLQADSDALIARAVPFRRAFFAKHLSNLQWQTSGTSTPDLPECPATGLIERFEACRMPVNVVCGMSAGAGLPQAIIEYSTSSHTLTALAHLASEECNQFSLGLHGLTFFHLEPVDRAC